MKDILQEIIASKKIELAELKEHTTLEELKLAAKSRTRERVSMCESLKNSPLGIIAEFKRRSPSKGWIKEGANAIGTTTGYQEAGAAAISVLTDTNYFGGSLTDLQDVSSAVTIPLLRKEFIIDEMQLYQAVIAGADAILLIAAALTVNECTSLALMAKDLGLETLLEIHNEQEIGHISSSIDMIGVNNRNLSTFTTSLDNSTRLAPLLPKDKLLISESGISTVEEIMMLRECGYKGFLIGEAFMRTANPGKALGEFCEGVNVGV